MRSRPSATTAATPVVRGYLDRTRPEKAPLGEAPPTVRDVTNWLCRRPDDLTGDERPRLKAILDRCTELHATAITSYIPNLTGQHLPQWIADARDAGPADVLSAIISRLRGPGGAVPLTVSYDVREKVWNPAMPLLFQRPIGSENRAFTPSAIRGLLIKALAATGLTGGDGDRLMFSPHDFRRIFVTDAIMSGLPPHIAQVICGHKNIDTTIGYKAVYPAEAIEAHRAFIARRALPGPARNTVLRSTRSGMRSSRTSRSARCPSAPAPEHSQPLAFMSTLV